jgi:RimJ/RimL family protein N-acetyltransferase
VLKGGAMFTVDDPLYGRASEIPALLTPRLRLREWTHSDVEGLAKLYENPEVNRFTPESRGAILTLQEIQANWYKHGFGSWAIADRKTDRFLGSISLALPGHWPTPEISWVLDPRVWGQGLATEGAQAVIDHAFRELKFTELMSVCALGNNASERVMQKLGMARTSFLATVNYDPFSRTYLLTSEQWQVKRHRTPVR